MVVDEEWKDVKGYEGLYKVSSKGRVQSLPREHTPGKIIKCTTGLRGYPVATLYKPSGEHKRFPVHRLVATAFIENPEGLPCVDHKNTDRTDNSVENLQWCSYYANRHNPLTFKKQRRSVATYFVGDELALDLAFKHGVTEENFYARLRHGWSIEKACTTTQIHRRKNVGRK